MLNTSSGVMNDKVSVEGFVSNRIRDRSAVDLELLRKIPDGDQTGLEQLYERYATILYSMILKIVRVQEIAENILQEVFLQIWNRADSYDSRLGSPFTWLIRIARNKAIDYRRSKHFRIRALETAIEDTEAVNSQATSSDPLSFASANDAARVVKEALARLPEDQRRLIEMAYYEGYTQSELAEQLSMPLGTVKTRMRLGILALREQFTSMPEFSQSNSW